MLLKLSVHERSRILSYSKTNELPVMYVGRRYETPESEMNFITYSTTSMMFCTSSPRLLLTKVLQGRHRWMSLYADPEHVEFKPFVVRN